MYHDDLGPESILWRYAGDSRIAFLGGTIGILQVMHPAIGAALQEHSNFFEDPQDRVFRSLPNILGAVYDGPEAEATGRWVRDQHRTIKGVDGQGRAYHALTPDTYWWAHATFQFMAEQVVDRFDDRRLTTAEREQLYQEGIVWYRRYGVSERSAPEDRTAFQREWDRVCDEVLEMNDTTRFILDTLDRPIRLELPGPLGALNPVLRRGAVARAVRVPARISAVGGLPARVRERFGIRWTRADQAQLDALELAVRKGWRFVPRAHRWQPRALAGWDRVRAERGERMDRRWRAAG